MVTNFATGRSALKVVIFGPKKCKVKAWFRLQTSDMQALSRQNVLVQSQSTFEMEAMKQIPTHVGNYSTGLGH